MHMKTEDILMEYSKTRNLKKETRLSYKNTIKNYEQFFGETLSDLLEEAEEEEENGVRWKHRKIKQRLIDYRSYLYRQYLSSTAKLQFMRIQAIYRHYEIELHPLPPHSTRNNKTVPPINFKDLPDHDIIKQALKISNPVMRAIILFMSSSGSAKRETLNLTIQDFIDSTFEYHKKNNIYEVIEVLKDRDDIIPMFYLKRQKTNKYYITFCSPEATNEIIHQLLWRKKELTGEDKLFKINKVYFHNYFFEINQALNLGKVGVYNRFRSHMLRKFHASQLYNDGMSMEIVDELQGRGKNSTHTSYFMEDPERLKEIYIEHLDAVTINLDVNNLNLKSPEYIELENENNMQKEKIQGYEELMSEVLGRLEKLESVNYDDAEKLFLNK